MKRVPCFIKSSHDEFSVQFSYAETKPRGRRVPQCLSEALRDQVDFRKEDYFWFQIISLSGSVLLYSMDQGAGVLMPQINGFSDNGICVLLRYLEERLKGKIIQSTC